MKQVILCTNQIRDFVNSNELCDKHFKTCSDKWNLLTVAMDTLEDSTCALAHFEENGLGSNTNEKYLRLYGALQAVILQQDAISSLHDIFSKESLAPLDITAWQQLRRIRNMAAGHPLDKSGAPEQGKLRIFVSQQSINDNGFEMLVCEEKTSQNKFEEVNLKSLLNGYKTEILGHLNKIKDAQLEFLNNL